MRVEKTKVVNAGLLNSQLSLTVLPLLDKDPGNG